VRHVLTVEQSENGRLRAREPEARRRRRETWARYRDEDREAVRVLRPALGMPDSTVARHLRELVRAGEIAPLPAWATLHDLGDSDQ
jgi:hypothetical protein